MTIGIDFNAKATSTDTGEQVRKGHIKRGSDGSRQVAYIDKRLIPIFLLFRTFAGLASGAGLPQVRTQ